VSALVGPNGAGKSTLLRLAAGLSRPSTGQILVFGERVDPARVGYLDQERPLYRWFDVDEMIEFGRRTNRHWDDAAVEGWIDRMGIPRTSPLRTLSVGQQAQVALAICLGKRPDLLLLDEPAASLDPLARRHLWSTLMEALAERSLTVVISSHILSELEPVCDHLVVLSGGRAQLTGDIDEVRSWHRLLVGPHGAPVPPGSDVVSTASTPRQDTVVVRGGVPPAPGTGWEVFEPSLEEIVLAYLGAGRR
jgi:ABC-2 type transport system ATP-binding protein